MAITTRTISRAKTLLKSDAWKGDHGFSGEGLTAWNAQREYFLSRLIEIITTRRKRIDWSSIPTCPQGVPGRRWHVRRVRVDLHGACGDL